MIAPSRAVLTLADFTNPGLILPRLSGRDAASAIQELSQAMQREGSVPDLLPFYHAALNREFLVGTEMDAGLAVPHARLPGLKKLLFAFGRSDAPLLWGTSGVRQVRLVCLLAVPATEAIQHLLLLAGLMRLTKQARWVDQIHAAQDALQVLEVLQQVQLRSSQDSTGDLTISAKDPAHPPAQAAEPPGPSHPVRGVATRPDHPRLR